MKFGAIMRAMREKAGYSQQAMAEKLHLSQSCVSKFENNIKTPDMNTMIAWAQATASPEVIVAFIMGIDGINIMSSIMQMFGG